MAEEEKNGYVMLGDLRLDLIWCPPGHYVMGCSEDEEGDAEDAPLHQVTLTKGFWLSKCLTTQAQYVMLADAAGVSPRPSKFEGDNRPVERVTWTDAMQWCAALNQREAQAGRLPQGYEYRLPTEAEWEYACRAGTTTALNNGKILTSGDGQCANLDEIAWYDSNSDKETHEVALKKANFWGLYDMHGNVEEWCRDWYGEYPLDHVVDPLGPDVGRYHVCRGGNMGGTAMGCSSSARKGGNPNKRRSYRGFRFALGPVIDKPIVQQHVSHEQMQDEPETQAAPPKPKKTPEELNQARLELEERLKVNVDIDTALKGKADVQGTRNFTLDEPKIKMLWCPAGTFTMGSPETENGRNADETQHEVTLSKGFWMSMYEITQEEYSLVADCAGIRPRPAHFGGLRRPVESVDWFSLVRWCKELTYLEMIAGRLPEGYVYRLPTEAEWEYACRAGTTLAFNNEMDANERSEEARSSFENMAWYKYNSGCKTHVVGERLPNAWGFCDMHGNVREWCWDWFGELSNVAVTDPRGPESGARKITRGGCYGDYSRYCRSAYRGQCEPGNNKENLGFRLVLAPAFQ